MADILNEINKIKLPSGAEYTLMPPDGTVGLTKLEIESIAKALELSIDETTYELRVGLDNYFSDSKIDLPLEEMVVGGKYNAEDKTVVLELKNKTTVVIPVADLINGLASQTTELNKTPTKFATYKNNDVKQGLTYSTDLETLLPKRLKPDVSNGISDPNTISKSGFYYITPGSTSRIPPFKQVDGLTTNDYRIFSNMAADSNYQVQIAVDTRGNDIFIRRNQNGT